MSDVDGSEHSNTMSEESPQYGASERSTFALSTGYVPNALEPSQSRDRETLSGDGGASSQTLFDDSPDWQAEWQGMPEFVQERQREYAKIIVRFRSKEDLDEFAALIGQRLNQNSQCTWHPELQKGELQPKVKYVAKS